MGKPWNAPKEKIKGSEFTYCEYLGEKEHLLKNAQGGYEIWVANKNHASYGLIYKNTHLEYVRSVFPEMVYAMRKR